MGLTMTSTMPPPMAQTTVAMANPAKGGGQGPGQQPQKQQPHRAEQVGGHPGGPVADAVHEFHAQHVHQDLGDEVEEDQGGEHPVGDLVVPLEDDEEQGAQVVDDPLDDIAPVTGPPGLVVIWLHGVLSLAFHNLQGAL